MKLTLHKQYIKDLKKAKLNQTNLAKLFIYVSMILNRQELPKEAKDHQLKGGWLDFREFHVSDDLLVVHHITDDVSYLTRIGTHSQIFG